MNSTVLRNKAKPEAIGSMSTVIATALASGATTLIVALAIGWLTIGRSALGREEVLELIATNAPYVTERQALRNSVATNTARVDEISQRLREIERQGHRVEAKLDLLLNEFTRREPPMTKNQ